MSTKHTRRRRALFAVLAELNEPPKNVVLLGRPKLAAINQSKRETSLQTVRVSPPVFLGLGAPKGTVRSL